jgi:uncharacterized protein (TIGR02118 family)
VRIPKTNERKTTMHKTTILFGYPKDPAAFDRHYHEVHLPLTEKLKGIRGLTIGKLDVGDNGEKAPYYVITAIYTDSREDLDATLATPEGQAVLKDVPNFATAGFTLLHDDEEVLIPVALS